MRILRYALFLLILSHGARASDTDLPEVPFERYVLSNGLAVVLHEDRSDPIVSVAVQYHVGSNRETPGHTGFAHLFEHIMFQESQHVGQDQFFKIVQEAGGTLNGGTGRDGTTYYEVVPKNALERVLWLEADRMGFLLSKVTAPAFANQQAVVINEKKQRVDNRPYGHAQEVICKLLYPPGHPYHSTVIGETRDLIHATLADVHAFHRKWYGPNNATLTVAGDFDRARTRRWIQKYFGEILPSAPTKDPEPRPVVLPETRRAFYEDPFARSPQLTLSFPTVAEFHPDSYALEYLAALLSSGKKTPLYRTLVEDRKLAPGVSAYAYSGELAGVFVVSARTFAGTNLRDVEEGIEEALRRFETEGFSEADLRRHKIMEETGFYEGIANVLHKAIRLGFYNEYAGSPAFLSEDLRRTMAVTPADVRRVYETYIKDKPHVSLSIVPRGQTNLVAAGAARFEIPPDPAFTESDLGQVGTGAVSTNTIPSSFDRSVQPPKGPYPTVTLPEVWHARLGNGLRVLGVEHTELPLVRFTLTIPGGMLLDDTNKVGVACLMASLMNEGTQQRTPAELQDAIRDLGAGLRFSGARENIVLHGNCLASRCPATIALMDEMLLSPRWDANEFHRLKSRTLESIKRRQSDPTGIAGEVFDRILYGEQNIPGYPLNGTSNSVAAITLDDLKQRYTQTVSPSNAYLSIAGDVSAADAKQALASLDAAWHGPAVDLPEYREPPALTRPRLCFVDVPGARQSEIRIGYLALAYTNADFYAATVMNHKLGGSFNSLFNTILREEKGYTYGARSEFSGTRLPGPFAASAAVTSSATLDSVKIFLSEMKAYPGRITEESLASTREAILGSTARRFETLNAILHMLNNIAAYDLPDDYVGQREQTVRTMTVARLKELARAYIVPDRMVVLVVGDAATQRAPLAGLGFGPPELLKPR